jgi:hypothetical protein
VQSTSNLRFEIFTAVTMEKASSGMLCRVALVKTDVSEEPSTSIRVTMFGELDISSQRASVASYS